MSSRNPSKHLIPAALFAALTAVFSQISVPLPFTPVPVNLATLSFFLAGGLLGPKYGLLSQIVYMCLGLVGLPVFAQFTSGPAILLGPTGGYIIGYGLGAFICGFAAGLQKPLKSALLFFAGLLACYAAGTLWFMYSTGNGLISALSMCVLPFLPGDALKITAAVLLVRRLWPELQRLRHNG